MSSPTPVHIPQLPIATVLNDPDVFVINQGGIDRQLAASFLKGINWAAIPVVQTLNSSDQVLIYQGGTSKKVAASNFFMQSGTKMWFYQAIASTGWTLLQYTGDALLAVRGQGTYSVAGLGSTSGTWQQTGTTLGINQIPNHIHNIVCGRDTDNTKITNVKGTRHDNPHPIPRAPTEGIDGSTKNIGESDSHDHGNIWRPTAYVGILCQKD